MADSRTSARPSAVLRAAVALGLLAAVALIVQPKLRSQADLTGGQEALEPVDVPSTDLAVTSGTVSISDARVVDVLSSRAFTFTDRSGERTMLAVTAKAARVSAGETLNLQGSLGSIPAPDVLAEWGVDSSTLGVAKDFGYFLETAVVTR